MAKLFLFFGGLISSHTDHVNVIHHFAHFLSDPAKICFFSGTFCKFLNFQDFSQNDEIPAGGLNYGILFFQLAYVGPKLNLHFVPKKSFCSDLSSGRSFIGTIHFWNSLLYYRGGLSNTKIAWQIFFIFCGANFFSH